MHRDTVALAERWDWPHGAKAVIVRGVNVGLADQWMTGWEPRSDDDVYIILEDDMQVSQNFYRWVKPAIIKYGVEEDDPYLFGFALQRLNMCVGESTKQRWGSVDFQAELAHRRLFLMQQVGPWGAVFFAKPWRRFVTWLRPREHTETPCVPSMLNNHWWLRCDACDWTAWHMRWAWETGSYALYFNFPEAPERGLVKNTKEPGEHFGKYSACCADSNPFLEGQPPQNWTSDGLPAIALLDLYDFHFRRVAASHEMVRYRPWVFSRLPRNMTCMWLSPGGLFAEYLATGKLGFKSSGVLHRHRRVP